MKMFKVIATAVVSAFTLAGGAQAGTVGVFGNALSGFSQTTIVDLYNGSATPNNHTASIIDGISTANVSGLDLLWLTQPLNPYTAAQLAVLNSYIDGGGRIAFLGEHGSFGANENNNINAALTALGSTMSINNLLLDIGFSDATRTNGQILDNPLTAGVNTYNYAAYAPMNVGGGTTLMLGRDLSTSMMSFENVRAGSIFMITDQNVFDNVFSTTTNDNAILFDNLVAGDTGNPNQNPNVIPLPAAGWMLLAGLGGLAAIRRRKKADA